MSDAINPSHYKARPVEVIDMMRTLYGVDALAHFCDLNAFKYRMRCGLKAGQPVEQDIAKALWYERMSAHLRGAGPDPRVSARDE
jgi:hypothetical protein